MGSHGKLNNDKGMALVFVAVGLVVLLALAGLAIDLGYMYVVKGQLQSAADSAALAGAGKLNAINPFTAQTSSRTAAVQFAAKNRAAGSAVSISSDGTNTPSPTNDVTVGHWDGSNYTANATPINSVQVRARRTGSTDTGGASQGGPVSLFLGKVFGFPQMGAAASAVAQRKLRATTYMFIGLSVCTASPLPPLTPQVGNMAWTTYQTTNTSADEVKDVFFCDPQKAMPNAPACGRQLYTSGGTGDTIFQSVETDFYDLTYDAENKEFGLDSKGNKIVTAWKVIVPVSVYNDPTIQSDPQPVYGYAKLHIIRVCGSGGGSPCSNKRSFTAPAGVCSPGEKDVVIDTIECIPCANENDLMGLKPSLVQ